MFGEKEIFVKMKFKISYLFLLNEKLTLKFYAQKTILSSIPVEKEKTRAKKATTGSQTLKIPFGGRTQKLYFSKNNFELSYGQNRTKSHHTFKN